MKTFLLLLAFLGILFVVLQSFLTRSTRKTEQQPYRVVKKFRDFEVRHYPPVVMATTHAGPGNYQDLARNGFRRVAGYIFGNNEGHKKIAMTAPVHMQFSDKGSSMSFVMPAGSDLSNLPKPVDSRVSLEKEEATYWAAVTFGGFAGDHAIARQTERLNQLLQQQGIKASGSFRYLGYNPPYQLVGRRNEVAVPVIWDEQQ